VAANTVDKLQFFIIYEMKVSAVQSMQQQQQQQCHFALD